MKSLFSTASCGLVVMSILMIGQAHTDASPIFSEANSVAFLRDVVKITDEKAFRQTKINDELLDKAIPLAQYETYMKANNLQYMLNNKDGNRIQRELQEDNNQDDFFLDDEVKYTFSGYSLKYAKCQPVQYFSENAITAGEHSPMAVQDIVILRLCSQKSCSSSAIYGCHYNYAEYALSLSSYLEIMLKYNSKKIESTCEWCLKCQQTAEQQQDGGNGGGARKQRKRRKLTERKLDEENAQAEDQMRGDGEEGDAEADEEISNEADDEWEVQQDAQAQAANDDAYTVYNNVCPYYSTYCGNYSRDCNPDEADDSYISYMDLDDIIDKGYLNCAEVKYNNYAYYVRPRCDGYDGTMKMAVFYDQFCVQHAGNDVSVKDMGLGVPEGIFQDYYAGTCIDCSSDDESSPPDFNINDALCNKVHYTGAKCTNDLTYDIFAGYESDTSECSFIEAIRFGTYDETGKLSASSITSGVTWTTEVSIEQKIMLGFSVSICIVLVFYACYIHHSMTNLLIKSLSHRELLPPSRHRSKSRQRAGTHTTGMRGMGRNDDDWEKPQIV
jgi:hypothetical protein